MLFLLKCFSNNDKLSTWETHGLNYLSCPSNPNSFKLLFKTSVLLQPSKGAWLIQICCIHTLHASTHVKYQKGLVSLSSCLTLQNICRFIHHKSQTLTPTSGLPKDCKPHFANLTTCQTTAKLPKACFVMMTSGYLRRVDDGAWEEPAQFKYWIWI